MNTNENQKKTLYALIGVLALVAVVLAIIAVVSTSLDSGDGDSTNTTASNSSTSSQTTTYSLDDVSTEQKISTALAANKESHADADDYTWAESEVTEITLSNQDQTITSAGVYRLSGEIADGQIIVDASEADDILLILNGINVTNSDGPALNIIEADKVVIILAAGSDNYLEDGSNYADTSDSAPNAALHSKGDLTITGEGSLTVTGNYVDGITSTDGLVIDGGNITVTAVDDGIRGKDYAIIQSGTINITAGGDGIKSDDSEDTMRGYVYISGGTINITANGDSISAITDTLLAGGNISVESGSNASSTSNKGIKADVQVIIEEATVNVDTEDDAIHSNGNIIVNSGTLNLATQDDGIHADAEVTINGGDITITKSYEGIESAIITINAGNIDITASDDGINVAGGNDGSGQMQGPGGRGNEQFSASGDYYLYLNGGTVTMDAGGDGLDSNGYIVMTGGSYIVFGPTNSGNGAIDYNGTFELNGGYLVAIGSSGMAEINSSGSQASMLVNFSNTYSAGTEISITNSSGQEILSITPTKTFQSIAFSSSDLSVGETYQILINGSSYQSLTLSSSVTTSGQSAMGGGRF